MALFVPVKFGYKELKDEEIVSASINDIGRHLGYNPDQTYTCMGLMDSDFQVKDVCIEIFSGKVIFVLADSTKGPLKHSKVAYFMKEHNLKRIFDGPGVETILRSGIENRSLDINFLARVLKIKDPALNGVFHVNSIGLNLVFEQGYLTDFMSADGLNKWAKYLYQLNPKLIRDYEQQAMKYWGSDPSRILYEINAQAEAYANTPGGLDNPYTSLHITEYGLIDFCMLIVYHHEHPITLSEFLNLNHGRYTVLDEENREYLVGAFVYKFSQSGDLVRESHGS